MFTTDRAPRPTSSPPVARRTSTPVPAPQRQDGQAPGGAFDFARLPLLPSSPVAQAPMHTRPLRPMPGGSTTRPMGSLRPFTAPTPAPSQEARIPASVASTVGPLGLDLLRTAMAPPSPVGRRAPAREGLSSPTAGMQGGSPLPASVRAPFERSFGYDLAPVRVHSGPGARRAAAAVNAVAFTLGDHIVLGGNLDVTSGAGRHVLGHELAHTVQSRLGRGTGRVSEPTWPAEREAERAAHAALAQRPYELTQGAGEELHRIVPWLLLAGLGLAAGLITWGVSDSPEENRRRHEAGEEDASRSLWALLPLYGSVQQIREAESYFQRVLGTGFLMLDFVTLGTAGVAARALLRAPGALIRTALARRAAGTLAVREGGELTSEAMAREAVEAFGREGGAVFASQQAASAEMMRALERGAMVVVTEGALNHSVIYARNAAGQVLRIHGGPLRVLFEEAPRALTSKMGESMARRVNAYVVIEGSEAAVSIEQVVARVQQGWPALVRWMRGTPTSCGILQGAVLEASGLPAATLQRLLPSGKEWVRLLPITLLDQMATSGLRFVEGGMGRIIGGTLTQGTMLAAGSVVGPTTSMLMRMMVNDLVEDVESSSP